MESSQSKYLKVVLKYLWLVILAAVVAGGATYFFRSRQQPYYQSEVRIFIGSTISSPDPSIQQLDTGTRLAQTYAQLITYDLLDQTIQTLKLPMTPEELKAAISTDVVPDTPILSIQVTYKDPQAAAAIANLIAQTLVKSSPTSLTDQQQERMNSLQTQITDIETQIASTHTQSDAALAKLNTATAAGNTLEITNDTAEYNRLIDQLNSARAILAQLSDAFLVLSDRTNKLDIVEQARPQSRPVGLTPAVVGIAGAVVGAILGIAALLYIEYSNNTLRTSEDIAEGIALPVLGKVSSTNKIKRAKATYLVVDKFPKSQIAEEYRNLTVHLRSQARVNKSQVYIITSAHPKEGKSFTTVNLAVSMASSGMRVLVIDADLRRPVIDEVFKLPNIAGLTTLLSEESLEAGHAPEHLENVVQLTQIPGLWVLTSGPSPEHPTEILGSKGMAKLLDVLQLKYEFDIILIDTPPTLAVADTSALALAISAPIIFVVESGQTKEAAAWKAKEQFSQIGVEIEGIVMNRNRTHEQNYTYSNAKYYLN